jgi:hypothetical protein
VVEVEALDRAPSGGLVAAEDQRHEAGVGENLGAVVALAA